MTTIQDWPRSSRNALKHGLCSAKEIVAPGDPEGFPLHQVAFHAQYQCRNPLEVFRLERIVARSWRLRRVVHMQAAMIGGDRTGVEYFERYGLLGHTEERFMNLSRYETALERSMCRAIKALKEAQSEKSETNPSDFLFDEDLLPPDVPPAPEKPEEPNEPEEHESAGQEEDEDYVIEAEDSEVQEPPTQAQFRSMVRADLWELGRAHGLTPKAQAEYRLHGAGPRRVCYSRRVGLSYFVPKSSG